MRVYIVTDGEYSDYRICGVYSTEVLAEEARKRFAADNIEKYNLDRMPPLTEHGYHRFSVTVLRNGDVPSVHLISSEYPRGLNGRQTSAWPDWGPVWIFEVEAQDEYHAVKIAGERRTQVLVANLWDMSAARMTLDGRVLTYEDWLSEWKPGPIALRGERTHGLIKGKAPLTE